MSSAGSLRPGQCSESQSSYDFGFAFQNPSFSDCTLRIHITEAPSLEPRRGPQQKKGDKGSKRARQDAATEDNQRPRSSKGAKGARASVQSAAAAGPSSEIAANSAILAAKSAYFRSMFEGGFRESAGDRVVDIELEAHEQDAFLQLLQFIYQPKLNTRACSLPQALQLLVLADRFDVRDCVSWCASLLSSLDAAQLPIADAWALLDLPEALHSAPGLAQSWAAAKKRILDHYAQQINDASPDCSSQQVNDANDAQQINDPQQTNDACLGDSFLALPDCRVALLLADDDLEVTSEDRLAQAALAWARKRHPAHAPRLAALTRTVWPRLRPRFLSPGQALQLGREIVSLLRETQKEPAGYEDALQGLRDACEQATVGGSTSSQALAVCGSASSQAEGVASAEPASLVLSKAQVEENALLSASVCSFFAGLMLQAGAPPVALSLLPAAPRQGYLPPCGTLHLEIPLEVCRGWEFLSKPAHTSKHLIAGRWLALEAQLIDGDPPTLGLYITTDARSFASDKSDKSDKSDQSLSDKSDRFLLKCQLLTMTRGSRPQWEVRPHSEVNHEFCRGGTDSWGRSDFLGMAWRDVLREHEEFFPEGVLRLRADIWVTSS